MEALMPGWAIAAAVTGCLLVLAIAACAYRRAGQEIAGIMARLDDDVRFDPREGG
jgi:hypothetical protein